ncbi:multidrug ABC transporter ATPase [Methylobacterium fujisawaense]|uniref:multidrug ABC transporter ATPase n=1 Tax=Methylobacterium fujisawaense TaxID=107400 RepID=UPI002F3308AA
MTVIEAIHALAHRLTGLDYPHGHWWIVADAVLIFVVAPAWTAWLLGRAALRRHRRSSDGPGGGAGGSTDGQRTAPSRGRRHRSVGLRPGRRLEAYVLDATLGIQVRLVFLSLATLPAAWLTLEIPKHIVNHALADARGDGHPGMTFLGLPLGRTELLFALCAGYLAVLTLNGLTKYAANRVRGRVNERVVRRLRLAVLRRARTERSADGRTTLAAVAVQEVEPIGYFGGSLVAVPIVQGGVLVTSVAFLLLQDVALGFAALIMLPVQLTVLPRLQRRLNAKVRQRVLATRALGAFVTTPEAAGPPGLAPSAAARDPHASSLRRRMAHVEELERVRVAINDMKGGIKSLYNYTSNLTPFFFFLIGGYLVVQGRLSLGALVAALAAYKEIAPALRELFDFAQDWSDAAARFAEVTRAVELPAGVRPGIARSMSTREAA